MKKTLKILIVVFLLFGASIFIFQKWYFNTDRIYEKKKETWEKRISENQFREYIPIVFQQDQLMEVPDMLSETHRKNVIHVLKFYGEKWKLEDNKLMISNDIEREISWNYTTKANDSVWLAEHPIEN